MTRHQMTGSDTVGTPIGTLCARCGERPPRPQATGGRIGNPTRYCAPCKVEVKREQSRAVRIRHPEERRADSRKARYGITQAQFIDLQRLQDGRCGICRAPFTTDRTLEPHIDHDHDTGRVRGLLCRTCNTRLGVFERADPTWATNAVAYLAGGADIDMDA